MSTRASVVVRDNHNVIYFYQHSDGYPEGLGEAINDFLESHFAANAKEDIEYLAGALISFVNNDDIKQDLRLVSLVPTFSIYGDEEYQYVIDADTLKLDIYRRKEGFAYK